MISIEIPSSLLNASKDISCDPAGPDSRGHGLNWFVSNDGLPAFRIELLAGANMQVAVRYEYETYVLSGCETDETGRDKVVQARFEAMEEAACQGRWQDVLFSLTSLQKWGPRPSAKTLGLGIKACTSSQSTDVWQQALPAKNRTNSLLRSVRSRCKHRVGR